MFICDCITRVSNGKVEALYSKAFPLWYKYSHYDRGNRNNQSKNRIKKQPMKSCEQQLNQPFELALPVNF